MARRQTAEASLRLLVEFDGEGGARLASMALVEAMAPPSLSLEPIPRTRQRAGRNARAAILHGSDGRR